ELEHRTGKARYRRTNRKNFLMQMTQIERRQRRLREIRQMLSEVREVTDDIARDPHAHYHIGITQNNPMHIPTWISNFSRDPALHGFVPALRQHLLPRIQKIHAGEALALRAQVMTAHALSSPELPEEGQIRHVILKEDRIYGHKVMTVNYTTYDIRRTYDTLSPGKDRDAVMFLPDAGEPSSLHYQYARVLGAYHANVVYTGPGSLDFRPRRVDFLWVRHFQAENQETPTQRWSSCRLEKLVFPPLSQEGSFGFIDPSDVIRGVHIIPAFAYGRKHEDGLGMSAAEHANDGADWNNYYVAQFSDRDLLMRQHWGQAVRHTY
ncbi:hypothetical protein OF83DRAFT_1043103, partial [Amylostereum chailletii]